MTTTLDETTDAWIPAGDYSLKLEGTEILARNAKGKLLKSVPAKVKKLEEYEQLDALRAYIAQHLETCRDTVCTWFLADLPVPVTALVAVWPDESWRGFLSDLLITDGQVTGLLREADETGLHLVDLDGESVEIALTDSATISIPHPVLIGDLADWREFAVELGVNQGLDQLFRETTAKPADEQGQQDAVNAYSEGTYKVAGHLIGRARGAGFAASLNEVSVKVQEAEQTVTVSLETDAYDPGDEARLGRLFFSIEGSSLPPAEVGPIAWSEGIRMAEYLWSGRTIEEEKE